MGEIADGILNGDFDEETGEYLGNGQGFPRSKQREAREKKNSKHSGELYGIINFLKQKKITNWQDTIHKYSKEAKLVETPSDRLNEDIALLVQKDFGKFAKWVKEYIKAMPEVGPNNKPIEIDDNDQSAADDMIDHWNSNY